MFVKKLFASLSRQQATQATGWVIPQCQHNTGSNKTMSYNTNRYGVTKHTSSVDIKNQPAPRHRHKPNPTDKIAHPSKLRPVPKRANVVVAQRILKHQSTARRVVHGGDAMVRQPNPTERGLGKKSLKKVKGTIFVVHTITET